MPKKTLKEQLSKRPIISENQVITIQCKEDIDNSMPALELEYEVKLIDEEYEVDHGKVTVSSRKKEGPLREYKFSDCLFVYYGRREDGKDEIVSIVIKEDYETRDTDEAPTEIDELLDFIELAQDVDSMQATRSLAFYWTSLKAGIGIMTGSLAFEIPEETDEEDF